MRVLLMMSGRRVRKSNRTCYTLLAARVRNDFGVTEVVLVCRTGWRQSKGVFRMIGYTARILQRCRRGVRLSLPLQRYSLVVGFGRVESARTE